MLTNMNDAAGLVSGFSPNSLAAASNSIPKLEGFWYPELQTLRRGFGTGKSGAEAGWKLPIKSTKSEGALTNFVIPKK